MRNAIIASALSVAVGVGLLTSCGAESNGGWTPSQKDLSTADCSSRFGRKYFMYEGLGAQSAGVAIEGGREQARMIVTKLLQQGGDGARNDRSACQLLFWTELAAQNGDLNSAYELATIDGVTDPVRCRRAKHWAKIVLERIDEFRSDVQPDADLELLERSISGRRKQMDLALQRSCVEIQE
jgi:hypothetical protein